MIEAEQIHILTEHPVKKSGVKMKKALYDQMVDFIVKSIRTSKQVTLLSLLKKAEGHFQNLNELTWYIYHVKLDLEARGFLKIASSDMKSMRLQLTISGLKHFKM